MSVAHISRIASPSEVAAEMDRRGAVIERLEAEIAQLRVALTMPDADRRQWFIADLLAKNGFFNRADICAAFGISIPQASVDIQRFLASRGAIATYNQSRKRYEARALTTKGGGDGR